jgi:hypothetical protein
MELNDVSDVSCPKDIIAVAINDKPHRSHCGIIFTYDDRDVVMCDMQWENRLAVHNVPRSNYYWAKVPLGETQIAYVSQVLDMVFDQHHGKPVAYSTVFTPQGFDAIGRLMTGAGITCATFIVNLFELARLPLLVPSTWKSRPEQDGAFREYIADQAEKNFEFALARRIRAERAAFRITPYEVYGSARHTQRPVRYTQAVKFARIVQKLICKKKQLTS